MNTETNQPNTEHYEEMEDIMSDILDRYIVDNLEGMSEAIAAARLFIDAMPDTLGGNLHDNLCDGWIAKLDSIEEAI